MNNSEINKTNVETFKHILTVRALLSQVNKEFIERGNKHDLSKLSEPEVDLFVEYTPKLKEAEYGSDKYKEFLVGLKPALDNHYKENDHHPEHYENGIDGMNLFSLLEMLIDWKASSLRTKNGNLSKSLVLQKDRFNISPQLYSILENTVPLLNKMTEESNVGIMYLE